MPPLVSILMPVYNAVRTLPWALASLRAQTFTDWECVAVDDGSTDNSVSAIEAAGDVRIRYHRLDRNYGRGYARQITLEKARGDYVTMLDADDWIYPEKLFRQLELFNAEPNLAAISTGMALCDEADSIVGIRKAPADVPVLRNCLSRIGMPPLAFAPSMLRTKLARQTGFDVSLERAQDSDFLLRALYGKRYAILTAPLYVYREHVTLEKVMLSLRCCVRMFGKHRADHPVESAIAITKARLKQELYFCAAHLGFWDVLASRRSRPPLATEVREYDEARERVEFARLGQACR